MGRSLQPLIALVLVAMAAAWSSQRGGAPSAQPGQASRPAVDPLATALVPLGPAKAILSSFFWLRFRQEQARGQGRSAATVAEGLLALHPDLDSVREYLVHQIVVTEAGRAPDAARHRALVLRGLALLEEGIARSDSPRLHGELGGLIARQLESDPRFRAVAELYFGAPPEEIAIAELREAERPSPDSYVLAGLLLARGDRRLDLGVDLYAAKRDLDEAERILHEFPPSHDGPVGELLDDVRALREVWKLKAAGRSEGRS